MATVREAWRLMKRYPRQTLLPMFVIEVPVALISAIVTAILYVTVFKDDSVRAQADVFAEGGGGPLFAFLAITAFEVLFAQVARGATIVGVAAARAGKTRPLAELLDPAFTRMGGLLALAVISTAVVAAGVVLAITIIGALIAFFIFLRWAIAFETFILEQRGVFNALGQSWRMMQGNMLRYLGVLLVSFALVLLPFVAISLLQLIIGGGRTTEVVTTAIVTALQGILVVPLLVFLTAVTTVFYFNIKERPGDRNPAGE
jgi:membrane-anchored glycerophosphoryl diester phosphodiesterase (GDPDase)